MEGKQGNSVGKMNAPAMVFTEDTKPYDSGYEFFGRETRWNDVHRGPILRVMTTSMELLLKFVKKPKSNDEINFESESEGIDQGSGSSRKTMEVEGEYIHETPEPFSATPKCKQTRVIGLTNEGTTTIRYQWLRFPPSNAMRNMLANPRTYLNLGDENGKREATAGVNLASGRGYHLSKPRKRLNPSVSDIDYSAAMSESGLASPADSDEQLSKVRSSTSLEFEKMKEIIGKKPRFLRDASFDFHFREMPGILLPGQSVEIPILYRPRKPGYCHENLYLLTHPRLTDEYDRTFVIRLTGICMEPDCTASQKDKDMGKERNVPDIVKRTVTKTMLELEGADLMDSVLDHALYMKQKRNPSTLPYGKLTPECIFYAHNHQLYYHYGVAERALKTVRKVLQVLIPLHRIKMEENDICALSIKDLYSLLWTKSTNEDFFRSRFKTTKTEKLLRRLAKCSRILTRPPIFAYANAGARKHMACYTNMVGVMDGIFEKMDSIKENFTETPLYRIQRGQLEQNIRKRRLKEYIRLLRKEKRKKFQLEGCLTSEVQNNEDETGLAVHSEPGEFETASEYGTGFPATKGIEDGMSNPPIGQETKDDEPNVLAVENFGTATEEETEARGSIPGAEMEFKDDETASALEETQELEADDEEETVLTPPKEEEEDKDPELKGKKTSTDKAKNKERKESEASDKDTNQPRKGKKTKRERSKLDKQDSIKKGELKPKGKKEKKAKGSLPTEEKGGAEGAQDDEQDSKNNSPPIVITPESLDDNAADEKKIAEEFIYGDVEGEVEEMLRVRTEKKIRQARLIAFENMLGCGIERMLSFVDTMRHFQDYRTSEFYPGEKYCCHQNWN